MKTLKIRLSRKLDRALTRIARQTGRRKSAVARDLLKRHVGAVRFRELRAMTRPFAEAQGLLSDEDVFRIIS
jgi:predicted transcriptional regulator